MKKILCVGNACVDVTVRPVDEQPELGKLKMVESIQMKVGGCAANTATDLARLGAEVSVCAAVGEDAFGDFILSELIRENLQTGGIKRLTGVSSAASVVTISSSKERSFWHVPGAADLYTPAEIPKHELERCDILFLTAALIMKGFDGEPAAALLKQAKENGKITVMDTCWDSEGIWIDKIAAALPYLDFFIPSIEEAEMLAGTSEVDAICDRFMASGVRNVIIKMGARGAYVSEAGGARYCSAAFERTDIVDTNGSGDAFCAGFLCALAKDLPLKECVRYANATGSFCVTGAGPSSGIPSMTEVETFLNAHR